MKKLSLALLLALSTQAFAQKNELVMAPGALYYKGFTSSFSKSNYIGNLEGGGFRVGIYYLRNIKWLQLGGGLEVGKLAYNEFITTYQTQPMITSTEKQSIGAPFKSLVLQANLRVPVKRFTFYAGVTGGYFAGTAKRHVNYYSTRDYASYSLGGFLGGSQAGVTYNILSRLSLSADLSARFVNLEDNTPPFFGGTRSITYYSHMNYYTFSLGVRYSF